jgi:hypothetical protein
MKSMFKCIAGLLVLSVIGLYCPKVAFCAGLGLFAKADQKPITRHAPIIMSEEEQDIPVAAAEPGERKKPNWLLIGLGGAAVIGLAAVIGGLGGGGGDGPKEKDEGSITVSW